MNTVFSLKAVDVVTKDLVANQRNIPLSYGTNQCMRMKSWQGHYVVGGNKLLIIVINFNIQNWISK